MAYLNWLGHNTVRWSVTNWVLFLVAAVTLGLTACSGPQPAQDTGTGGSGHAVSQEVTWVNVKDSNSHHLLTQARKTPKIRPQADTPIMHLDPCSQQQIYLLH